MITVSIYNKCETELNSTTGFTEDFKLFKIKYSKNLFSLSFKTPSEITKKYVDSLVEPDFECVSADFDDSCDRLVLNFEKVKTKAAVAQPVCSQTGKSEQPVVEENKAESPENQPVIGEEETQSVEQPKPKKPRARRRTKAEMEAARAENAKKLIGIS